MSPVRALDKEIGKAEAGLTIGQIPEELLYLVAEAMDIIAPDLGSRVSPDAAANMLMYACMRLMATFQTFDKNAPTASASMGASA